MPYVLPMFPTCCRMEVLGLEPTFIHSYTTIYHIITVSQTQPYTQGHSVQTTLKVSWSACYCFSHTGTPHTGQDVITIIITAAIIMIANI